MVRLGGATYTVVIDAADPSQARTDEIYIVVRDDPYDSLTTARADLRYEKGTPGSGAPGPDASWESWALIATVLVPASAADIEACTITDEREIAGREHVYGGMVPTGAILPYGGTTVPAGYLLADGSEISRSTYAALFAILGEAYGNGNGSTTFDLPDMRQSFPLGKAALREPARRSAIQVELSTTTTRTQLQDSRWVAYALHRATARGRQAATRTTSILGPSLRVGLER